MFTFYENLTPFSDSILEDDDDTTENEDLPDTNFLNTFFFSFLEEDNQEPDDDQSNNIDSMDSQSSKPLQIITDLPETYLESVLTFETMYIETPTKTETPMIESLVEEIIQSVLEKMDTSEIEKIVDKETETLEEIPEEKQPQKPKQIEIKNCGFCVLQ